MNAPLPLAAEAITMADISAALRLHRTSVLRRSEKDGWPFEEACIRGGRQRLYPLATLPEDVAKALANHRKVSQEAQKGARMRALTTMLAEFECAELAAEAERRQKGEAILRDLAGGLSAHESLSMAAHCEIAESWTVWFHKAQPLRKSASWVPYANAYNAQEVPISKAVRAAYEVISPRSVQRWVLAHQAENIGVLVDRRNGCALRGKTYFSAVPLLAAAARKLLIDRPGIRTGQLHVLLKTASIDRETGEQLFTAPSYDQVRRYQQTWIEQNRELYLQATNPDAWKNSCLLAFGSLSEDVTALNGRWEMDATPADWLLLDTDGKKRRYTVSVIIDVWSRRMLVVVARTPKTQTHCHAIRLALLLWGVPKEIVTDNGQDYQSHHFKQVLRALSIEHLTTHPFSPEEKPHVERVIGTLNHSILELLPNFAGHSVADRKAIEARRSFADRLAKRGELADFSAVCEGAFSGEQLQTTINTWIAGIYEQRPHGALGCSPFAKAASWQGDVARIADERSLDILLAKPAGSGQRTLQKKGIALDGTWFIAPELARIDVGSVLDIYETTDLGRVVVYWRKNFLCIAEAPERTGADRQAIAATARIVQAERNAAGRKAARADRKGLISTEELLARHLADQAAAAGKLVIGGFGAKTRTHTSHGLDQAAEARQVLDGPQPSSRAAQLSALAAKAMAEAPTNVAALPSAEAHATPLAGMTNREKYELWGQYDALVKAHGGDVEVLGEAWQRRFYVGFPTTPIFRAEANLAKARKETGAR